MIYNDYHLLDAHSQEPGAINNAFRTGVTWVLGDNPTVG